MKGAREVDPNQWGMYHQVEAKGIDLASILPSATSTGIEPGKL